MMQRHILGFILLFSFIEQYDSAKILKMDPENAGESGEQNYNAFFDVIFSQFKLISKKENLDPFHLHPFTEELSKKILIITLKAGANITSGSIQGISSMYRAGNITLRKDDKGFYLTTDLGVKSLTALLEGNLYVLSKSFSDPVIVTADMKGLRVKAVIFQAFGDTTNATLHEFKITNIDIDASARIPGSSVLSWALGKLVTLVKKFFKEKIDHLIENKAKEVVGRVLQKHHLPLI